MFQSLKQRFWVRWLWRVWLIIMVVVLAYAELNFFIGVFPYPYGYVLAILGAWVLIPYVWLQVIFPWFIDKPNKKKTDNQYTEGNQYSNGVIAFQKWQWISDCCHIFGRKPNRNGSTDNPICKERTNKDNGYDFPSIFFIHAQPPKDEK
jgi:uncharacterized membrane protein